MTLFSALRRPAVVTLLSAGACALIGGCTTLPDRGRYTVATASQPVAQGDRPNIVFILADDLGIGDVGIYGQRRIKTPNIDRLRAEGMLFTDHYSGSPVCAPSRASLMTGRDTAHSQIRGNRELGGYDDESEGGQEPIAAGTVTIASLLKGAGYATAGYGKWGLGFRGTTGAPTRQGFDTFLGWLDQKQAHNYYPTHLWLNETRFPLRNPPINVHPNYPADTLVPLDAYKRFMGPEYGPAATNAAAVRFVSEHRGRPFFLYLAYVQPHASLQVPDEDIARFGYRDAFPETPHEGKPPEGYTPHPTPRAARAAMISRMDDDIGKVLAEIDRLGLREKTLVVFTSDNGASSEGGADLDFFHSTGGFRGQKRDVYEGGIRAPLVVRWPGHVAPGSTSHLVSAFWDFLPTFADVAHVPLTSPTEGISIVPTLIGAAGQKRHDTLYWEFTEAKPAQAVRQGDWKAVRLYRRDTDRLTPQTIELYDLASDPGEKYDVASNHPKIVARLGKVMGQRVRSYLEKWNFNRPATP